MNILIAWLNFILTTTGFVFLCISYYRSRIIFVKAKIRDVREILSYDILTYEKMFKIKLIAKGVAFFVLMVWDLSRITKGSPFLSVIDMIFWNVISIAFLLIGYIDLWCSSPLHQHKD